MKVTFVSHAGFITEVKGKRIFTDPWTMGKAFNDGWSLYAKPCTVNYEAIDYIFVSHEHPDHFSFPTLKNIPLESRKKITILYQKHSSTRLLEAFNKLEFKKVIELPIYKWTTIDDIEMYCGSVGSMDSFLAIKDEKETLLNLNDCVLKRKQYEYIKRQIGDVTILFSQFSFANWVGNTSDQVGACTKKINDIKLQKEIFQCRYIVPFASFVYFCNEENSRMNAWANTPQIISSLRIENLNFMYPGDTVDLENPNFNNQFAVQKYMDDINNIVIDRMPPIVPFEEIERAINENLIFFKSHIKSFFKRYVEPFTIFIHDLNLKLEIDPQNGVFKRLSAESSYRYEMCSQVCWYTFKYPWGTGTLMVSGMYLDYEFPKPDSKYFSFQNMLSTELFNLNSSKKIMRTIRFFWRKKWEIFYRFI